MHDCNASAVSSNGDLVCRATVEVPLIKRHWAYAAFVTGGSLGRTTRIVLGARRPSSSR